MNELLLEMIDVPLKSGDVGVGYRSLCGCVHCIVNGERWVKFCEYHKVIRKIDVVGRSKVLRLDL